MTMHRSSMLTRTAPMKLPSLAANKFWRDCRSTCGNMPFSLSSFDPMVGSCASSHPTLSSYRYIHQSAPLRHHIAQAGSLLCLSASVHRQRMIWRHWACVYHTAAVPASKSVGQTRHIHDSLAGPYPVGWHKATQHHILIRQGYTSVQHHCVDLLLGEIASQSMGPLCRRMQLNMSC